MSRLMPKITDPIAYNLNYEDCNQLQQVYLTWKAKHDEKLTTGIGK